MISKQEIIDIVENQRKYFKSGVTRDFKFRINQLKKLKQGILKYEKQFSDALMADLRKSEFESYVTEIGFALYDLKHNLKHLKKWMKPKKVKTPVIAHPARSVILYDPLGVNLIISPFNYPVGLTLSPLIAAIAAGNTAVIKTSELTPACSDVISKFIGELFDPEYIAFVPGEIPETTALLEQKFDHIFFTGSPNVGSIVMSAAAKNLTRVTLELGGKSPCVVHHDAKLDIAVKRIVYGKFMNAGQTCVAPDYILVHKDLKERFLQKIADRIKKIYGPDASTFPDYGRMVNERHFNRVLSLIDKDKVVIGGESDIATKFIAPTVLDNVSLNDEVMKSEIFGPVLPVLEYENIDEITAVIDKLPLHPLAFYVFSEDRRFQNELLSKVQFGGGCVNHTINHLVNPNLPFGGIGNSGLGDYHGFAGFERFSHRKSVLKASTRFDLALIYPPYAGKLKKIKKLLK